MRNSGFTGGVFLSRRPIKVGLTTPPPSLRARTFSLINYIFSYINPHILSSSSHIYMHVRPYNRRRVAR